MHNFRAADLSDPKDRMVEVVRWYLSSISASKKVILELIISQTGGNRIIFALLFNSYAVHYVAVQ